MINDIKKKDLQDGENTEILYYEILKNKFDNTLKRTPKYSLFDYESDNYLIEIKKRNNNHDKYKTTIIPQNKIKFLNGINKKIIFVFVFDDKTLYHEYDMNKKYNIKMMGRNDRGIQEYKYYINIDIKDLKDINDI